MNPLQTVLAALQAARDISPTVQYTAHYENALAIVNQMMQAEPVGKVETCATLYKNSRYSILSFTNAPISIDTPLYVAPQAVPAEPSCPDCKAPDLLYECIHCSASNYPPEPKVPAGCEWTPDADFEMGDTYHSSCGELWSFIDGGPKENRISYCHHCGKPVKLLAAPKGAV